MHLDVRGKLYAQGAIVPRNPQQAVNDYWRASQWDLDAQREMLKLLAMNPETTTEYPKRVLYDAQEAADLGEPGALAALIDLKLSDNEQFADKAGGCAPIAKAIARNDRLASLRKDECAN